MQYHLYKATLPTPKTAVTPSPPLTSQLEQFINPRRGLREYVCECGNTPRRPDRQPSNQEVKLAAENGKFIRAKVAASLVIFPTDPQVSLTPTMFDTPLFAAAESLAISAIVSESMSMPLHTPGSHISRRVAGSWLRRRRRITSRLPCWWLCRNTQAVEPEGNLLLHLRHVQVRGSSWWNACLRRP